MQKEITIPDIGVVLISKKNNATKLKLRVHPEKGVLVTIPYNIKFKDGEAFLYKNLNWVKEKVQNQKQAKRKEIFTSESIFLSRKYKLHFNIHDKDSFSGKIKDTNIDLYYNPSLTDFTDKEIQDFIKKMILKALKIESQDFLVNRIKTLSGKAGIKFNKISIGTAKTRWGCCNGNNEIILSCRLLLLPDELIDYIILHELSHVVHKNHSPKFHALLDKLVDGHSKELNSKLKKYSINIKPGDYRYTDADIQNFSNKAGNNNIQCELPFPDFKTF